MRQRPRDRGAVLPIVLVIVVVLGVVVVATATYATTNLRYGQVVESRADRLSAAQAATDDAIEQLRLQRPISLCGGAGGTGTGVNYDFPEVINGSTVQVSCRLVNGSLPNNDGFALVITGHNMNLGGPTFDLDNGGEPEIRGPIYIHDPSRIELKQDTTIFEGDLVYQDTVATSALEGTDPCDVDPDTSIPLQFDRVSFNPPIDKLVFDPSVRGLFCVNKSWSQLFSAPPTDPALGSLGAPAIYQDLTNPLDPSEECRVFSQGRYTNAATELPLADNNYFRSGVYHFDNLGLIELASKQVLTFGNANLAGFPAITNTECEWVRSTDSTDGAIVYTSGSTSFRLVSNPSGIDVSGREIEGQRVALHALATSLDPELAGLIESDNGNGREAALHGQLWAPHSSLLFLTIPSKKSAILRGGAVIAAIRGKVSAAGTDGFLIEVSSSSSSGDLQIDAVATNADGSTTVRSILDYRTSNGDTAVLSRRVIWE